MALFKFNKMKKYKKALPITNKKERSICHIVFNLNNGLWIISKIVANKIPYPKENKSVTT